MAERNGVAFCASSYKKFGRPPRRICAAPVFAACSMSPDDLPLQEIYDHPDFVDLISAQEFDLEKTENDKLLLCIVAAQTPAAVKELCNLIMPTEAITPCAGCDLKEDHMELLTQETKAVLPIADDAGSILRKAQQCGLSLYEILAALTSWATGFSCTMYREAGA